MKHALIFSLAALLLLPVASTVGLPSAAEAQASDHRTVPLAVVRFNQPRVYFQRPVANAVRRALQVSPGVEFNVVHYTPDANRQQIERAERNLQAVIKHLYGVGVRPEKVTVRKQVTAGLPHSEVHVYVR